jgi:hypothetical protein
MLIQSIHVFAGVFILAVLAVFLICDPLASAGPRRRGDNNIPKLSEKEPVVTPEKTCYGRS